MSRDFGEISESESDDQPYNNNGIDLPAAISSTTLKSGRVLPPETTIIVLG
jgi:hypothetical protein